MSSQPLLQSAPGTHIQHLDHVFSPQGQPPAEVHKAIQEQARTSTPDVSKLHAYGRRVGHRRSSAKSSTITTTISSVDGAAESPIEERSAEDVGVDKGKRISLPVRVEPKVFFANERTFLSWLNFSVILGGLAIGLLNFGDRIGQISAGLFTLVAMAAMVYALGVFHWRAGRIRRRGAAGGAGAGGTGVGGFDDRFGPTVLTLALAAAVIVNFVLRVVQGENEQKAGPGLLVQELR